jgi:uncharacterized protein (DUF924 family)
MDADLETHKAYLLWCFRGGADDEIGARFSELTEAGARGDLDGWAESPRGRLALIIVLDQFSRSVFRGTPRAFAQDHKALGLTLEGLENGHYDALETAWERMFFGLPLGHAEGEDLLARCDVAVELADALVALAPEPLRPLYLFSAEQPRRHREVIARFGRHPHRNRILGRASTPEELAYLEVGEFPHQREVDL